MILRSLIAFITASSIVGLATAATPVPPPTNLRASAFEYNSIAKVHRFLFEWAAPRRVDGTPYTKFQLSRGKGCSYEVLNPGDTIVGAAATWVVTITGPRVGVTAVCGCNRAVIGYTGAVRTVDGYSRSAAALITKEGIEIGHQSADPRFPYNISMTCT